MADKKISQLTTLAQADVAPTADFLPIVDTGSTETKKATPEAVVLGTLGATTANVGIGTASPVAKLSVQDASVPKIALQVGGAERAFLSYTESTFTTRLDSDGPLVFAANNAEVGRFDVLGNLGIGTASPTQRLNVVGGNYRQNDATNSYGFELQNGTGTSRLVTISGGSAFAIQTGGNAKDYLNLDGNGSVTIGDNNLTTTSTNGFLYVPTCAGVPTGTPTAKTGYAPIVVDTTNNRWYFYSGGAWRDAGP